MSDNPADLEPYSAAAVGPGPAGPSSSMALMSSSAPATSRPSRPSSSHGSQPSGDPHGSSSRRRSP